ncbi:hypothetical protein EKK58_10430 [Candidatus Dependentiae bacterium]|nr:MAG: hypothetical protein EKK58_10430 [Candidatus Dependentiae bacterium]
MNKQFLFCENVKQAFEPKDLTTSTTGERIKMNAGERIVFVLSLGDSVGASTLALALKQHNAASGGTTKALAVSNKLYKKMAAATVFTETEMAATDAVSLADFAADPGLVVVEVLPQDLDVNNGFAWFSVDIAAAGAAKIGGGVYIVEDSKYQPAYAESI